MAELDATKFNEYMTKFVDRLKLMHATRHRAVKRLNAQKTHSKWTLALLAIAVIIVELQSQSDIAFRFSKEYVDIISVVFSVMTLAYSLLLGMGDFSGKSVKMYYCALALGELQRKAELQITESPQGLTRDQVDNLIREYNVILSRCENHDDVDYLFEKYKTCSERKICLFLKMKWLLLFPFSHYYVSLVLVYGWIIFHSVH